MTVTELIARLEKFPSDMLVVCGGYEGGVDELQDMVVEKIKKDVNDEWYYGKHEVVSDPVDAFDCEALHLGR